MTGYESKRAAAQDKLAQPAQEPVVTIAVREHAPVGKVAYVLEVNLPVGIHNLYTTPPQRPWVLQREWVDLTDEEIDKWAHELHGVIYAVMAELKEKNT